MMISKHLKALGFAAVCTVLFAVLTWGAFPGAEAVILPVTGVCAFLYVLSADGFHASGFLLSAALAVFFTTGMVMKYSGTDVLSPAWEAQGWLITAGLVLLLYILTELLNSLLDRKKSRPSGEPARWNGTLVFFIFLICWTVHLVIFFPGSVYGDTYNQLKEFYGITPFENSNPFFTTILYGSVVRVADVLTGNTTYAVALAVFLQTVFMAACFAYGCVVIRRVTGSRLAEVLLVLWFSLNPIYGGAAQCLMKDSLHMAFFVVFLCSGIEVVNKKDAKPMAVYTVFALLCALSRKGAIAYVLAGNAAVALLFLVRARKEAGPVGRERYHTFFGVLKCFLIWLMIYIFFEQILIPFKQVRESPDNEYYSTILQQLIYVAREHRNELTEAEETILRSCFDLDKAIELYDPNIVDPIRAAIIHYQFEPGKLINLYLLWLLKYPGDILAALTASYWKYVCPFEHANSFYRHYFGDFSVFSQALQYLSPYDLRNRMYDFVDNWMTATPWREIAVSCGLYAWIFLFSLARMCRKGKKEMCALMVPLILLFVGLFLTHVNGESRYAYPLIACAPLTLALSCAEQGMTDTAAAQEPAGRPRHAGGYTSYRFCK